MRLPERSRQWNADGTRVFYARVMPVERLLASYIVRIRLRNGVRSIELHHVGSSETRAFSSYHELIAYLAEHEEAEAQQGLNAPPAGALP